MAAIGIVAVLCAVAATAAAWDVPAIPAGRRAQYYLLKDDGAYQFGYDTGAGHSARAAADAANEVRGAYQYKAADGRDVAVSYSAGQGGYVPQVGGLQGAASAAGGSVGAARIGDGGVIVGGGGSPAADQDPDYDANADASYSFSIDTDSYQRHEQADARGNVRGHYAYSSPDGGRQTLAYEAGEGTGFVVTGGSSASARAPAAATAPAAASSAVASPDGGYAFSFDAGDHSRQEAADAHNNVRGSYSFRAKGEEQTRRIDYEAGAATGFVARGDHLPAAPVAQPAHGYASAARASPAPSPYSGPLADIQNQQNADGSYSFAFGTDFQSRHESADGHNNVRGSYSYTSADDGKTRRVDYQAGAATGFLAQGEHLPVAPAPDTVSHSTRLSAPAPLPATPALSYAAPVSTAARSDSSSGPDGSYSFAFSTDDQSRQESADAQNNVRGSYSFKAKDDGKVRRVDYEAGAATGFVARGDHLPLAPAALATSYSGPTSYAAPAASYLPPSTGSYSASDPKSDSNADGSYSFSYSTQDHSRQESADAHNNVRGSYSFKAADDGQTRRVDYEAGAATGFVAKGAHLPVAPAVPAPPTVGSYSAPAPPSVKPYSPPGASSSRTGSSNTQSGLNPDGSYSFSYSAGDHSREESGDASNNVRGSYSFRAKDDGKTRRVDYEAGAATGFIARGDHLPQAPVAGVASARAPAAAVHASAPALAPAAAANADGSYSFSYDAGDHSRQEAGDAAGNVRGSFSFVAKDDGRARRVDYSAGADTGFVAAGSHLPVPVSPPAAAAAPSAQSATTYAAADSSSGDASYSYNYQTDSSSKFESADAQGNVQGEYSYVGGDGTRRRVSNTAQNDKGFVVTGDVGPSGSPGGVGGGVVGRGASVTHSRGTHDHSHGALSVRTGGVTVNQYLPPQSAHKYGYIFDTKA